MKEEYLIKTVGQLSSTELYHILQLRSEVFIIEQQCIYQDLDGKDLHCYHLMCYIDHKLAAYTRLLPAGLSYPEISIGRVAVRSEYRKLNLGRRLMEKSIRACEELFAKSTIRIGAQYHLTRFYHSLGFIESGQPYDEDGIVHVEMVRASDPTNQDK
ncbi:MAG: GNAT family N-acetyltransferase [Phocaeicola sp.]